MMLTKSKLSIGASIPVIAWIITPIFIMLLNLCSTDQIITYKLWLNVLYICGGIGFFCGSMYLTTLIDEKLKEKETTVFQTIISLMPLVLFLVFGIWCIVCTSHSDLVLLSIFGRVPMSDSLFTYFAFFGMVLSGVAIGNDKKIIKIIANIFITMTFILAFIALMNNGITTALCNNERTNTIAYQAVFYNTNHYAYYLAISLIINAYLLYFNKDKKLKIYYTIVFITLTVVLVLNNTMGSYLAVLLTYLFAIIWAFINKEDKKRPLIILGLFILISLITLVFSKNLLTNFGDMFSDLSTISSSTSSEEEIGNAGSGRILLWQAALVFIKTEPIYGWGPQTIAMSSHNMFLQIAIYFGIPGLLLYLLTILSGVIKLIKVRKTISPVAKTCAFAAVAYLISGFFGVTVFYTAPYFYLILGLALSGCMGKLIKE